MFKMAMVIISYYCYGCKCPNNNLDYLLFPFSYVLVTAWCVWLWKLWLVIANKFECLAFSQCGLIHWPCLCYYEVFVVIYVALSCKFCSSHWQKEKHTVETRTHSEIFSWIINFVCLCVRTCADWDLQLWRRPAVSQALSKLVSQTLPPGL